MRTPTAQRDPSHSVYHLAPEDANGKLYAYAPSIVPTSRLVNTICEKCGRGSEIPEGSFDVVVEGAEHFPDLLYCGAYPFLIVSEYVTVNWDHAEITNFSRFQVRVKDSTDGKAKPSDAPQYFRIEVTGSCEVNLRKSGLALRKQCVSCGRGRIDRVKESNYAIKTRNLQRSHLFRDSTVLPGVIFCSSIISDLAAAKCHSNMSFHDVRLV